MDSSPRLKPANRPDSQGAGQQQTLHTGVTMAGAYSCVQSPGCYLASPSQEPCQLSAGIAATLHTEARPQGLSSLTQPLPIRKGKDRDLTSCCMGILGGGIVMRAPSHAPGWRDVRMCAWEGRYSLAPTRIHNSFLSFIDGTP